MTPNAAENATAGVPVVRGLVWDAAYDSTLSRATTVFGTYRVWTFAGARSWYWELDGSRSKQGARNSEDEAKAAAQADYEQRIRSALNPDFLSALDTARAEIERLRAALKPFAEAGDIFEARATVQAQFDDDPVHSWTHHRVGTRTITVGDFRRARATITPMQENDRG